MTSLIISRTCPRKKARNTSPVSDAETCPRDCKRLTSFMMVSPSVAPDENWKVAESRVCSPGDHLSTFNNSWDVSLNIAGTATRQLRKKPVSPYQKLAPKSSNCRQYKTQEAIRQSACQTATH